MIRIRTSRLTSGNRELAKGLFIMMAEVFGEKCDHLSSREDFWAIAAFVGDEIVRRSHRTYAADEQEQIVRDLHL